MLVGAIGKVRALFAFIKERFSERSTYIIIPGAAAAASQLLWPWNLISFIAGIAGAMVPDGNIGSTK